MFKLVLYLLTDLLGLDTFMHYLFWLISVFDFGLYASLIVVDCPRRPALVILSHWYKLKHLKTAPYITYI